MRVGRTKYGFYARASRRDAGMITVVLGFGAASAYGTARFLEPQYQVQMLRNMLGGQESSNQAT